MAAAALAISVAPIAVKLLILEGVGPTAVGLWRVASGAAALLVGATILVGNVHLPRAARKPVLIAGVMFGLDLWLWHRSIILVGAGMATILGNTQVFWAAGLGRLLYGEKVAPRTVAAAALAFVGIVLLSGLASPSVSMTTDQLTGVLLGLVTGLSYAAYVLALRQAGNAWGAQRSSLRAAALNLGWTLAVTATVLAVSAAFEGELAPPTGWKIWGWILLLGLGMNVGAWLVITAAAPLLPAATVALLLLLQPALATVWGAWAFDEVLQPLQLAGAVLALGAIVLGTRPARRRITPTA